MAAVHENARPFFFKGGRTGCLVIHGFTGSPSEVGLLGERLNQVGYTVSGVLLAGHGTNPEEMAKTNWRDWFSSAEKALNELRQHCDEVYLVGFSMGGLVALYLSIYTPVKGVVSLSAPTSLVSKKVFLLPLIKVLRAFEDKTIGEEERNRVQGRFAYNRIPLNCLASFMEFMKMVRQNLDKVTSPLLIMHSTQDKVAAPKSAKLIYDRVGSKQKELIWLNNTGHLIAIEEEREVVFDKVIAFLHSLGK